MTEPLTPVGVEAKLRQLINDMSAARKALAETRDEEVLAKQAFKRAHRRTLLSPERPKVTRGGWTTAERDAWVDLQCEELLEAYELAGVKREAAEDHLKTLFQQGMVATTLSKSVQQAYAMAGTGER